MGLGADPLVRRGAIAVAVLALLGCPPDRKDDRRPSALVDPALVTRLDSAYASERAKAAFELGQLGVAWDPTQPEVKEEAERRLCDRLYRERDDAGRVEIVAALGRVGGARARRALLSELDRPGPARARAGWALAHLYRRVRDKADVSADIDPLVRALIAPEAEVRAGIVDALAEIGRPAARPHLVRELFDTDALARARAARGLIGKAEHIDIEAIESRLADPDERVAAGAAGALAMLGEKGDAAAIAALQHSVEQLARPVVLQALTLLELRRAELAPVFAAVEHLMAGKGRVQCLAAFLHDRSIARVERVRSCGGNGPSERDRQRLVANVLGSCDPALSLGAVDALTALPSGDAPLRAQVVSSLGRYDDPRVRPRIIAALDDPDSLVRASAAEIAAEHGWNEGGPAIVRSLPPAGSPVPVGDLDTLLSFVASAAVLRPPGATERLRPMLDGTPTALALAAREALGKLGERPSVIHPLHPRGPYDTLVVEGPVLVQLETTRGSIVIELDLARAPRNARNFLGLVRRGFYDGLSFHRVVPGFVIQGGDPTGTGVGGAGHLVACEPNNAAYLEGTVGMALSGPDTGSSQFFIALAPAPHLEGRYTAFGRVVSGMDVARAVLPDDVIKTAREVKE